MNTVNVFHSLSAERHYVSLFERRTDDGLPYRDLHHSIAGRQCCPWPSSLFFPGEEKVSFLHWILVKRAWTLDKSVIKKKANDLDASTRAGCFQVRSVAFLVF